LDDSGHHRRKVISRRDLPTARRVVLKVGSSVLVRDGAVDHERLASLVDEVAALKEDGVDVALVTSGAIAAGCTRLGLPARPQAIPTRQAAAAVGQSVLMHSYEKEFARHGIRVGQVLLTQQVVDDRSRYLNARHTLRALFALGAVPIINENDTVATDELGLGDNDRLSAIVSALIRADALVLLTNVEGLNDAGGPHGPPRVIEEVEKITAGIRALASDTVSNLGFGGMRTKLEAARVATLAGAAVVIASGIRPGTAARVLAGKAGGTFFPAATDGLNQRRLWIACSLKPRGELLLDDGAVRAVCMRRESVLPVGIHEVRGEFREGDCVRCLDSTGGEIARGLAAYGARDARRIAGRSSDQIEAVLGYKNTAEVISRGDLVVTTRRDQ
jgi:glutamate 5-kinase